MTHSCSLSYIGLGGNLGDVRATFEQALAAMDALAGCSLAAVSNTYRNPPMGPASQPDYLNAVAALSTSLKPLQLLDALQRLEVAAGRVRDGSRWSARTLDLDLLAYNRLVTGGVDHGGRRDGLPLLLPHPEMANRAFVMAPLAELSPSWAHPKTGVTAAKLWQRLEHSIDARNIQKICGDQKGSSI